MATKHDILGDSMLVSPSGITTPQKSWLWAVLGVALLATFAFLPGLGGFGLIDPSDGLYAEGAREMLESKDFVVPHLNYAPFFEKPILIYWLIAASFKVFGLSEFAARLPSALSSIGGSAVLYMVVRRTAGTRAALLSTIVLLTNLLFITIGHLALTDAALTFCCTLGFLCLFLSIDRTEEGKRPSLLLLLLAYASFALSFMLKGPVIIVLASLTLIGYKLLLVRTTLAKRQTNWLEYCFSFKPFWGLLVFLLVSLPWFIAVHIATSGNFTHEFFIGQNVGRALGRVNHREPVWFYVPYLCVSFLPWLATIPYLVPSWRKLFRRRLRLTPRQRLLLFCCSWLAVTTAVFFAVPTKLPPYILPAIPPLAILIGSALDEALRCKRAARRIYLPLSICSVIVSILLAGAFYYYRSPLLDGGLFPTLAAAASVTLMLLCGIGGLCLSARQARWPITRALALSIFCSIALAIPSALICFYNVKDRGLRNVVEAAGNANLATLWRDTTAGVFYHKKQIVLVMTVEDMAKYLASPGKPHLILCPKELVPFMILESKRPGAYLVKDGGHFCLYDLDR